MKKEDILKNFGDNLEETLYGLYVTEKMSTPEIAGYFTNHFGEKVEAGSIWLLLKEFNINIRSISDSVSIASAFLDMDKEYLNPDILNYMDGLMLSDGSIGKCGKYHRFSMGSSHKEFADYCFGKLNVVCSCNFPKQFGKANHINGRDAAWAFSTGVHRNFTTQYNRWYKDGIKIIPLDVSLSPQSLLMWYYGDGTLIKNDQSNTCVLRLSTDTFNKDEIDMIIKRMSDELGIYGIRTIENRIRLRTNSIPIFLKHINIEPVLTCYKYKFDLPEWRFFTPMKQVANNLNIPYNRLSHLVNINAIEFSRSPGGKKIMFSKDQIEKLKALNNNGLLVADARVNSASIAKGKYNRIPKDIKSYLLEVRRNGFPYMCLNNDEILSEYNNLYNVPMLTINGREFDASYRNNNLAMNFHRHLFSVSCLDNKSPVEAFNNDEILSNVLRNMVDKNEELSSHNIIKRICSYSGVKRTSVFPVRVAKTLIAKYGKLGMKILDPCAGYSSRLLGFMSQGYEGKYVGIDPCKQTVVGLKETFDVIKNLDKKRHECEIISDMAESYLPNIESESYDIIFTSPPYFNLEKYDNDDTQSYIKYPRYDEWRDKFLFKIILECKRIMKPDGTFLLNIANARQNNIIEDVGKFVKDVFRIENVLIMHSPSSWLEKISEPIFVFKRN
jgi:tRNA1(Val) A37 N6-methylase TrmN6